MAYMRTLYHRGVGVCHISKGGWIFILAVHDYRVCGWSPLGFKAWIIMLARRA